MAVSSTSFTKTPQASNDVYDINEDYFNTNEFLVMDVMADDLGGNAKTLYSIDNGDALKDLLSSDVGKTMVSEWEPTASGNLVRINLGKVEFKLGEAVNLNSYAAGETYTDTFTYSIRLGNGTISTAKVTVNITGENDLAVITGDDAKSIDENGTTVGGTLIVSDLDHDQNTMQADSQDGAFGSLSIGADGKWEYTLAKNMDYLAAGEFETDTFTVKSFDGTEKTVAVTINGSNDVAVITGDDAASIDENGTTVGGTLIVSDLDHDQNTMQADDQVGDFGSLTIGTDGKWEYTLTKDMDYLAAGKSETDTFTVKSFDGTEKTIAVTINGSNDVLAYTLQAMPTTTNMISGSNNGSVVDNIVGTSANDLIEGLNGSDILNGAGGDDIIKGGTGHDQITGGTGFDYLYGDNGNDTFFYTNANEATDVIKGFAVGSDKLNFSGDITKSGASFEIVQVDTDVDGSVDSSLVRVDSNGITAGGTVTDMVVVVGVTDLSAADIIWVS